MQLFALRVCGFDEEEVILQGALQERGFGFLGVIMRFSRLIWCVRFGRKDFFGLSHTVGDSQGQLDKYAWQCSLRALPQNAEVRHCKIYACGALNLESH